ncbi:uncharacterized protein LOC127130009 [Lathyrus oleraceus]|uniref:uncharacterized protein LOC127130009 n=1 Tax=Pisum sativum TaxID=3888 RepID=UPI0021CE63E9|nr:uncharacterized protein LOC127130009 [Pisum sativum]
MNAGDRERDVDEFRALGKFQRNNPPTFEGAHEPEKAQEWLKAIEKIFRVINYSDAQKVQFGTHMLEKEVVDWWRNTVQRFDEDGIEMTWALFRDAFPEKYFPEDVRGKKEIYFLELKQGNGTVAEYVAKFEELIKFCPHYNNANAKRSKCLKFVNGLRPDIKKAMGYQHIMGFSELVNKSRIYDEDSREVLLITSSCMIRKEKGNSKGSRTMCNKMKKEQAKGKVFALSGADTSAEERLIRAKRLNLELSIMRGSMVIDTLAMGSVTTSSVCLKCPLNICDKDFEVDLVCLPLSQLDVIYGMDWLRANHVYINYFAKAALFLEPEKEGDLFLSTQQVNEFVQDGAEVFMLVASLKLSENGTMGEFPVVCDFPEVFPDEVNDFPPERKVEFTIDLIPGTSPISMAPCRMSPSELKELKSQLEDLFDKRFIRPNEHHIAPPSPPETPPIYEYLDDPISVDESDPETPLNYYNLDEPETPSYAENLTIILTRLDGFRTNIINVKYELKSMHLDVLGLMDTAFEQFDHLNKDVSALGKHHG